MAAVLSQPEQLEYVIMSQLFPKMVVDDNGCWFRSRKVNKSIYNRVKVGNKRIQSHVFSASLFLNFDLNSKLFICHKCDTPACFNPNHLFIGTCQANLLDASRKKNITSVLEKLNLSYDDLKSNNLNLTNIDNFSLENLSEEEILEMFRSIN